MAKNVRGNYFYQALSKMFIFNKSKLNNDSQGNNDSQLREYQVDVNSQQYLHPYLVDRVEPSVEHIIFSSYIKF
ncbi:MAG: hypothetical protein AAFQ91_12195 [Cyanobacteria bacterium J06621_15]